MILSRYEDTYFQTGTRGGYLTDFMHSFELRHVYPWPRSTVWAALDSPDYAATRAATTQSEDSKVRVTQLSDSTDPAGRQRVRKIRHTLERDLPRLMQRFTGPSLSYLVTETIDPREFIVSWQAVPELRARPGMVRRIDIRGTYAFDPHPDGCERIVKARIEVAILGFGGRIEQAIAKSLRHTHAASAEFALAYLQERLG